MEGYTPERYLLTTEHKTVAIQEDPIGLGVAPSISADGSMVASPGDLSRAPRLIASTYSVKDGNRIDHPEFEGVWCSVAISPDGSKLASVTRDWQRQVLDLPHIRLRTLDLRTGKITAIAESSSANQDSNFYAGRYDAINDFQISIMSPLGTHSRVLMEFSSDVYPNLELVWSPGSRKLLVSKPRDPDNGTFDIYMVDVVTGKSAKKFKNVAPVYAWIAANQSTPWNSR